MSFQPVVINPVTRGQSHQEMLTHPLSKNLALLILESEEVGINLAIKELK